MPGVGQNLNNHASTEIFFRIGNDYYYEPLNDETIKQFFTNRTGPMTSTGLSQVGTYYFKIKIQGYNKSFILIFIKILIHNS